MEEISLECWLAENKDEIAQLQAFSIENLSDEPALIAKDLSRAQRDFARVGFLLADAESFHSKALAEAIFWVRKEHPDLSAEERKAIAKDRVRFLAKLKDNLGTISVALKSKSFVLMNINKTMIQPHMNTSHNSDF